MVQTWKRNVTPRLVLQLTGPSLQHKEKSISARMTRHILECELPLPIYIGLNVIAQTRSKKLVQHLYCMVFAFHLTEFSKLKNGLQSMSEHFEVDDVVAPAFLCQGHFTVGALDNLDLNQSSTTSVMSFHGTRTSMFQLPTKGECGVPRPAIMIPPSNLWHWKTPLLQCQSIMYAQLDSYWWMQEQKNTNGSNH